jgi:DNA (cytosine-5)-methyltransferase 1
MGFVMTKMIPGPAVKLNVLDLFSGIGGFSLGLERTGGFKTVAFCEIDPFCSRVLKKHWPEVPCYHDVRQITAEQLAADGIAVDVICGGFPCQDLSFAGKGAGLEGERSGLWSEIARLSGELRPRYIIVENVAAILNRGIDRVLGDLAALGFSSVWHCIPASAVGAPHRRDRFWLVAYPSNDRIGWGQQQPESSQSQRDVANSISSRYQGSRQPQTQGWGQFAADYLARDWKWPPEPDVCRMVNGIPHWSHRIRALGNAVVPQVVTVIGNAILAAEAQS